jgi:hypothetical protein
MDGIFAPYRIADTIRSGSDICGGVFVFHSEIRTYWRRIRISKSLSLLDILKMANRSKNMENNDISSVRIMNLPLRYWFYKSNSLPHIGMLFQYNEDIAFLRASWLARRCGWNIYTLQDIVLIVDGKGSGQECSKHSVCSPFSAYQECIIAS